MFRAYPDPDQPRKKIPVFIKILALLILICFPMILLWVLLTPVARSHKHRQRQYTLAVNFNQPELYTLAEQLKSDPEYAFYFSSLSPVTISRAVAEVYAMIGWQKDQTAMLETIKKMQSRLERSASAFELKKMTLAAADNEEAQKKLNRAIWDFIYEDFKLALAGVCYRIIHDNSFFFVWSKEAQGVAYEINQTVRNMDPALRDLAQSEFARAQPEPHKP